MRSRGFVYGMLTMNCAQGGALIDGFFLSSRECIMIIQQRSAWNIVGMRKEAVRHSTSFPKRGSKKIGGLIGPNGY